MHELIDVLVFFSISLVVVDTEDKGLDGCSTVYCPFRKDKPPASHNSGTLVL